MRKYARFILIMITIGSFTSSIYFGYAFFRNSGTIYVDYSTDQLERALERALAQHVDEETVTARLEELLVEEPRNWMAIEAVEEIAQYREISLPADIIAKRNDLYDEDTGILKTSGRCISCMWDPKNCDFSWILACRAPVDLTPIGDVTSIVREGKNYVQGREVDEIDLGLSAVGLVATVLIPATGGTSGTVKVGAGVSKTAWRMGRISSNLVAPLRKSLINGFDWAKIRTVRSLRDFRALVRPEVLQPATDFISNMGRMKDVIGMRKTLYVISKAGSLREAARYTKAIEAFGPKAIGALELLGKQRLFRIMGRYSDEFLGIIASIFGTITALIGVLASVLSSLGISILRRLAR